MGSTSSTSFGEEWTVQVIDKKTSAKENTRNTKLHTVYNIKMDSGKIVWDGVDLIGLTQDTEKRRAFLMR
jgi:hypothetical protein